MTVYNHNIITVNTDRRKPRVDARGFFIVPTPNMKYRYYCIAKDYNNFGTDFDYLLLISDTKFDNRCHKCNIDMWGRLKFRIAGELRNYCAKECAERGNIDMEYLYSENGYDVFEIK